MNTGSTTAETGAARFSRQVAWTMGTRLMIAASSITGGVIVARWLGPGGVGVLASLAVLTMLAINIGGLGLPSAITFLVARDRQKSGSVLINAVTFGLVSGLLVAAIMIVAAKLWPGLFGEIPPALLNVVALSIPVQMLTAFCLAIYLGLERIKAYNLIDLILQGIILINAVVLLVIFGIGLNALVIFGVAANVAIGLTITVLLGRDEEIRRGPASLNASLLKEMLRYGLRFFVAMAAGLIILRGDLLIVNYFRGADEAGVYAVATQIATFLHMMPNVISTLLFPRTSGAGDTTGKMTCRVTRHAVFIMLILCLVAIPAAFLLPILYGPGFSNVPVLFLVLLPGVFLLGIETIQVQHFSGLGLPRTIPIFWIVTFVFNVALNLVLVPHYGAMAAAAVSTVSYLLIFILVLSYFRAKTGRSFVEAFVIRGSELRSLINTRRATSIGPVTERG